MPLTLAERLIASTYAKERSVDGTGETSGDGGGATEPARVRVDRGDDVVVVRLRGEHDVSTVSLISTGLVEAVAVDGFDVVVDLSDVTFMDGSTIGALVHGQAQLACRRRHLEVRGASSWQCQLLEICGLSEILGSSHPAPVPPRRGASTPLESWVEVPRMARAKDPAPVPVEPNPLQDDPERSRR